jgi:glycosyltransferase involved in cell wall biosynthesis
MSRPLVSIIIPFYNASLYAKHCLDSVMAQTYQDWEAICINHGSIDGGEEEVLSLAKTDPRIRYLNNPKNAGVAFCRNMGVEVAQGRFIAFLDMDDAWHPLKLEKQLHVALNTQSAITHTAYEVMDAFGNPTGKIIRSKAFLNYSSMLNYNFIGNLTAMVDTHKTGKITVPLIKKRQDYALWLSLMRNGHSATYLDEPLAFYRTGIASLSSNKWETIQFNWKLLRELEGLSFLKALYHFSMYAWIGFKKYFL